MAMVCKRCSTTHEQRLQCPSCGGRLEYWSPRRRWFDGDGRRWMQTPWGRICLGVALAQGLFYGARHMLTAVLKGAYGDASAEAWSSVHVLVLFQALQLCSVLLGGMLAGSGQRAGIPLGSVVGIWNGVFSVLVQSGPGHPLTAVSIYGQPLLQTTVGALGGWAGCLLWKPLLPPVLPGATHLLRKPGKARRHLALFSGKVAWLRVTAGIAVAVAGTLSATIIFDKVLEASNGVLSTSDQLQDQVITWEIKALALLVGGCLAGATTPNGLKQGLFAGLGASSVLIGIQAPYAKQPVEVAVFTLVSAFSLTTVGGWFGSQLFPPVIKFKRKKGLGPAAA
jgi:hypothetical protein